MLVDIVRRSCLIVDDSQDFLDAAARLLEADGMTVVGFGSNGREAVAQVAALAPDLVLVDVELGDEDGIELAGRLAAAPSPPTVIVISSRDQDGVRELLQDGPVAGFLTKDTLSVQAINDLLGW